MDHVQDAGREGERRRGVVSQTGVDWMKEGYVRVREELCLVSRAASNNGDGWLAGTAACWTAESTLQRRARVSRGQILQLITDCGVFDGSLEWCRH
jgi:hypothetical protein